MITREDLVEQSVFDYVKAALEARGYVEPKVELLESFPYNRFEGPIERTYVAAGFESDDDGEQAELGSDLMRRVYSIEFFVFGLDRTWGKNTANVIKFAIERDGTIPLLDYGQDGTPEIDRLVVLGTSADRQAIVEPEPWQEFIWLVRANVEDVYHASLV